MTTDQLPNDDTTETIEDEGHSGKYFHIMLNMYDDDLDVYQYRLLGHYKRVCGNQNKPCTQGIRKIAATTRMSIGQVSGVRRQLAEMDLISVTVRDSKKGESLSVKIKDRMLDNVLRYAPPRSAGEQTCSCGEIPCSCREHPCSSGEQKNNGSANRQGLNTKDSLSGKPDGVYTASKFYLVSHAYKQISIKPHTKKEATAEAVRLNETTPAFALEVVKGSDLNTDPTRYQQYKRIKPAAPRKLVMDAFLECAYNLPAGYESDAVKTGDLTQVHSLIDSLALMLSKTKNEIMNDETVAAQVRHVYAEYKVYAPTLHAPRKVLAFLGEWNTHIASFRPSAPKPAPGDKPKLDSARIAQTFRDRSQSK